MSLLYTRKEKNKCFKKSVKDIAYLENINMILLVAVHDFVNGSIILNNARNRGFFKRNVIETGMFPS
jgi:hypothetical protein